MIVIYIVFLLVYHVDMKEKKVREIKMHYTIYYLSI